MDALSGFTKLFSHIVHSTVWREEMHVKVVWITMLALADRHGQVSASVPGLADAAKVSLGQCEDALRRLSSPDPYSRTKDHEGRRIAECEGGWSILNHARYRERKDEEQTRLMTAARVKAYRERKRETVTVTHSNAAKRKSNGIPEAEADTDTRERKRTPVASAPVWSGQAIDDWNARFGEKSAPAGRIGSALKPLVNANGWEAIRTAWRRYLARTEAQYASPQRFAATWQDWVGDNPRAIPPLPL